MQPVPMTEEKVEQLIETHTDVLDRQLLRCDISPEQYDQSMKELYDWADKFFDTAA